MKRWTNALVLLAGGAIGIAAFLWTARDHPGLDAGARTVHALRPGGSREPARSSRSELRESSSGTLSSKPEGPDAAPRETAATDAEALPPGAEPAPAPGAPATSDYGFRGELLDSLHRYRSAPDSSQREDALLDLAMSDDPDVLRFFADELGKARMRRLAQLVEAVKQNGNPVLAPRLRELARSARSYGDQKALLDAAEYLDLPSFTELRLGVWRPEPGSSLGQPVPPDPASGDAAAPDESEPAPP